MTRPVALLLFGLALAALVSFCGVGFIGGSAVISTPPHTPAVAPAPVAAPKTSAQTALCGPIEGKTTDDLNRLVTFCSKGLVPGTVVGAMAMESLLWLKVSREFADSMRADRLGAEQMVKTWMKIWRSIIGRPSVTVYVEWQDVEIAKGDSTMFGGDEVTIR